ncbi:MAG: sensor histidine kinase KdpD [Alphaproteobacteria bacterium]|nr:sensor histidine kinase KdpD [Alphaproteobacteria bacterium]
MNDTVRPDPDKLLHKIQKDDHFSGRGILKIFFGACAGVGKTYAMLNEAKHLANENVDVVIGLVETHGRKETQALVEGLPIIPRKIIRHRDVDISEFDLDAALERKPAFIILDEYAHTNAPGSRHPKRWQDVEELLDHGIHVYTTLNVQHLESINDLVARTSGIHVRETVPDSVFDQAQYVSLVDIPTEQLLDRLKNGKVYLAEHVRAKAAEHFFEKRNLIALREMALQRMTERVDAQMGMENTDTSNREAFITERILVCVGHDSLSTRIIRHAKRLATRMKSPWFAVYVETSRHYRLDQRSRDNVESNLQLAERMGGIVVVLKGDNAVDEILNFAKEKAISRIVVGLRHRGWIRDVLAGTLAEKLIRRNNLVEINVITDNKGRSNFRLLIPTLSTKPIGYASAPVVVGLCTLGLLPLRDTIEATNLVMIYLIGVMLVAMRYGIGPSVLTSFLGVGAFNFFFTEPYYTFNVLDTRYHLTFFMMFVASLIIGSMASRLSLQITLYRKKEQETRRLLSLAKSLASTRKHESIGHEAARYIGEIFNAIVTIWYPSTGDQPLSIISNISWDADLREKSAAFWAFENGQNAGNGTDTLNSTKGLYIPLMAEGEVKGVLGVIPQDKPELEPEQITMVEAFATIIAISFQRANKALEAEESKVAVETEKLRNVLLQSVSHDLRTPLVSITGLSNQLLEKVDGLATDVRDMIKTIYDQSTLLSRMVNNVLDISRLESGKVALNRQPYFLDEIIGAALLRLKTLLPEDAVQTHIETNELIEIDGLLIEQVFTNLLENACRSFKGDGTLSIAIQVEVRADDVKICITDNGHGLASGEEQKIFDKFYKSNRGGTGLGLAICRAIIEAHNGQIWAKNNPDCGAVFCFTLPNRSKLITENNDAHTV